MHIHRTTFFALVRRLAVGLVPLCALVLIGCTSPGSEYLGDWENSKNPIDSFTVIRDGEGYAVVTIKRSMWDNKELGEEKLPAFLVDGALQVQAGFASSSLTYVESSDTITAQGGMGTREYARKQ